MKMIYGVKDKPAFGQMIIFAIQQLLAIMAATLVVPIIIGNGMQPAAALFGAGIGTIVYALFTKFKSPVFLGSSFAFIGSMFAAFAGAASTALGYLGIIIGAIMAGLVYVVIAVIVKFAGVKWINVLMPTAVIGPTVSIIGLSLAGNAIGDLQAGEVTRNVSKCVAVLNPETLKWGLGGEITTESVASPYACIFVGLVTLAVTMVCSVYGKKMARLIPFIFGILAGYFTALVMTLIGVAAEIEALQIIRLEYFSELISGGIFAIPSFSFLTAFGAFGELSGGYIAAVAVAYVPVAFVVFAEHIADHKNLSSIIEEDLLEDPGLHRTLLGDGVGSMVGAFFGGCPNTTYGESVGCVAITKNASVVTIVTAAILSMVIAFIKPFVVIVDSIPPCVMGGVCIALYGFIAVSGLKMIQKVDLEQNKNLFVVSVILIAGIGGLAINFGAVTLTNIATALILGILANLMLKNAKEQE